MKRKLLSFIVALLCSVGTWAYGWTDGSVVGTGEYYMYNIGSERFMTSGCWWGTHMAADGAGKVITISGSENAYNLHMAGVDAAKWLSGGAYTDTPVATGLTASTDDNLKWTFESVSVEGYQNVYKIKNNSTNNYLRGYTADTNTGHKVEVEAFSEDNSFYWLLISKTTRESLSSATNDNPIDATYKVTNPDGEWYIRYENDEWKEYTHGGWTGAFSHNSTNQAPYVSSFYEIWAGDWNTSNGTKVGNNWHLNDFDEHNEITSLPNGKYRITMSVEATQQVDAETITGANLYATASYQSGQTAVSTRGNYDVDCVVTNGTITAGVKTVSTTANWVSFDNLRLTYYGNAVEVYSPTSFTNESSAAAGKWYEFTINTAGTYKIASTEAVTFYYTQDDSKDADEAASVPIAASSNNTIGLAAGKLYFKSSATSTITITSLVPDGTYYLYDATNKLFLGRGANNGTRAIVDKYGVPFTWTASTGLISFADWAGRYLFFDKSTHSDCWVYTDGAVGKGDDRLMAFTDAGDGKVYLQDAVKAVWIKHDNSVLNVPVTSASTATKWTVMTKAEHDAIVNAYPTDNIGSVIAAAGISATVTTSTFENYLSTKCKKSDLTSKIGTATFGDNKGDWTVTTITNSSIGTDWIGYRDGYACYWQDGVTVTQTIDKGDLPAGIYKVTMAGFDRRSTGAVDISLGNNYGSVSSSYLKANGEQVRIKSWKETMYDVKGCDGNESWETQKAALNDGTCDNVLYVYLDGNTDLTLTVARPNLCPGNYISFGNFTLTRYVYDSKVDAITTNKGDITSLINGDFQENTTGWSGGKHVDWVTSRGWRGDNTTKYYEAGANGTLSYTIADMPAGTYKVVAAARSYSGGVIQPEIAGTTGTSLTGVGDAQAAESEINTNGVEMPYNSTGGFTTDDYGHNWKWITATGTLDTAGDLVINFNCTGSSWMAIDDVHLYCTHLNETDTDYTYTVDDDHLAAGDKVVTADIVLSNPNKIITSNSAINGATGTQINNNLVSGTVANLVLYDGNVFSADDDFTATAATLYRSIALGEAEYKYVTICAPFAITGGVTGTFYQPTELSDAGVLTFGTEASPAAGKAYLLKAEADVTAITGSGTVKATPVDNGSGVTMKGVYNTGSVPESTAGSYYYIVSAGQLHKVTGDGVTYAPFRAYFELTEPNNVKGFTLSMNFDDNETGISSIDNGQLTLDNAKIYNLAGQRVSKAQKGIYILNGKKILVK